MGKQNKRFLFILTKVRQYRMLKLCFDFSFQKVTESPTVCKNRKLKSWGWRGFRFLQEQALKDYQETLWNVVSTDKKLQYHWIDRKK